MEGRFVTTADGKRVYFLVLDEQELLDAVYSGRLRLLEDSLRPVPLVVAYRAAEKLLYKGEPLPEEYKARFERAKATLALHSLLGGNLYLVELSDSVPAEYVLRKLAEHRHRPAEKVTVEKYEEHLIALAAARHGNPLVVLTGRYRTLDDVTDAIARGDHGAAVIYTVLQSMHLSDVKDAAPPEMVYGVGPRTARQLYLDDPDLVSLIYAVRRAAARAERRHRRLVAAT